MQLPLNSIALAVVAFTAVASASQPNFGSSGNNQRFIRKRAPAGHGLAARARATADASLRLAKRAFSGTGTFYNPSTGPGACGKTFQKSDPIVAVNTAQFDLSLCYTWITVTANGKSVQAEITDSCPSCSYGDLDFSPAVFDQFATPDQGVFQMSWVMGSGSDDSKSTSSKPKTTHHTPTSTYTPPSTTSTPKPTTKHTKTTTSSTPTPTTSSSHSTHSTSTSASSSSSTDGTDASSTSSAATSTATDDGDGEAASQTSSGDESVETLGSGSSNNLGLLSEAVGGFAAIAQAVSDQ